MRTARKLALKKEALAELGTDELHQVAGAGDTLVYCKVSQMIEPCPTVTPACTVISRAVSPCPTERCP